MSQSLQKSTNKHLFVPSAKQSQWLDAAVAMLTDSPAAVARECGVDRTSWYKWLRESEGFEDWFYEEYRNRRKRILPKLDEIGMKYAGKGDHRFWRDMNKKIGEILDDAPTSVQQINIGEILPDSKYGNTPASEPKDNI